MSEAEPSIIERSVEKTHMWLKQIAEELGDEDRQRLRGFCGRTSLPGSSTLSWRSCQTSSGC